MTQTARVAWIGALALLTMGQTAAAQRASEAPLVKTLGYHNVHISVPDPAAARAWYSEHLGATDRDGAVFFGEMRVSIVPSPEVRRSEGSVIDHIGISSHSIEVLRAVITSGEFAAVMLEYSAFAPETVSLIELAIEHDVGVIVMRPLGGSGRTSAIRGRIDGGYDGPLTPANLLRYVLSNPGVSVAIPGARYPSRIEQNVATATSYAPMDAAEMRTLEAEAAQLY